MSERKPPEDNAQGPAEADSTPDWISELYRDSETQMPPAEVDSHILQLAAKKAEAPRSARHRFHPRNKWVGALASAAVVVLSIGVFLSGEMTEQMLEVSPAPTAEVSKTFARRKAQIPTPASTAPAPLREVAVDEDSLAGQSVSDLEVVMDSPVAVVESVAEAEPSAVRLRQSKEMPQPESVRPRANRLSAELKQERDEGLSDSAMRLVSADSNAVGQALEEIVVNPDCSDVTAGLCVTAAGQFMTHPDCEERFQIPEGAQDVMTVEGSVVLSVGPAVQHVQCLDGQWQVEEPKIE